MEISPITRAQQGVHVAELKYDTGETVLYAFQIFVEEKVVIGELKAYLRSFQTSDH